LSSRYPGRYGIYSTRCLTASFKNNDACEILQAINQFNAVPLQGTRFDQSEGRKTEYPENPNNSGQEKTVTENKKIRNGKKGTKRDGKTPITVLGKIQRRQVALG
jgi:hypothetical protein